MLSKKLELLITKKKLLNPFHPTIESVQQGNVFGNLTQYLQI